LWLIIVAEGEEGELEVRKKEGVDKRACLEEIDKLAMKRSVL
jgi:hypothetical protein